MRILIGIALSAVTASGVAGQERDYGPILLFLPANTRALALGGAFPIGSSDAAAVFYNPAMSAVAGFTLDVQRYGEEATTVSLAAGMEWWGGRIGAGLQAAQYGVSAGLLDDDFGESALAEGGGETVGEQVATVSYARRIKGLRLGVAGKLIAQRALDESVTTGALDLSTGITVRRINLGLALQNIGPEYDFLDMDLAPPLRMTLGAAFTQGIPIGPLDFMAAAALSREADGTVVPGGGIEFGYWPISGRNFFARAGVRDPADDEASRWTVGAGFNGDRITLDWAFFEFDDAGSTHRITVRWR
jgi:hypothetical protein